MRFFDKLLSWYFKKDSLPYWCIFIIDSVIVLLSTIFTYWLFNKTQVFIDNRYELLYTSLIYVAFSWIGFKVFHTYSGIIRFSSFVDLMRVAYGSMLSLIIALIYSLVMEYQGLTFLSILSQTETVITFVIATLAMWAVRIVVKTLYDMSSKDGWYRSCQEYQYPASQEIYRTWLYLA